ncbi:MAG: DUF3080 family protein [Glaciecola sp.]|jgi:hypothetical protein
MLTKYFSLTNPPTYIGIGLLLGVIALLTGCQPHQSLPSALDEYQTRIHRVLAIPEQPTNTGITLNYPEASQRSITIPRTIMPLAEFYAISGCELAPLIAQRNTALGKVEYPSRRLVYESTLLHTLTNCIKLVAAKDMTSTDANAALFDTLKVKQIYYPKTWANVIQNSHSMRLGLGFSPGYIEGDASDGFVETKAALQYLYQAHLTPPLNITQLEAQLDVLESFRLPARLYRSTQLITLELGQLNQLLTDYNAGFTCGNPIIKEQIKILNNVMKQFFIQTLQPIASHINHYQRELTPILDDIMASPEIHPSMRAYLNTQAQSFVAYQAVFTEHVTQLQQVLASCGLRPTAN